MTMYILRGVSYGIMTIVMLLMAIVYYDDKNYLAYTVTFISWLVIILDKFNQSSKKKGEKKEAMK